MTVCKFFQQGFCRYGQNCRFEHIYGTKYSYHAQPSQPKSVSFAAPQAPQAPQGVTDEQLVKQVQSDVQAVLRGGQWILSCYSPIKEKVIFPGIPDLSAEEARLFIYEAKANNTLDQAVEYMNKMFQESRQKYERLLQPDHNIIKVLKAIYNGERPDSPFSNTNMNTANDTASSIFRSAVQHSSQFSQNTAQSVFSQGQSSIFGSSAPDPAKELFSKATGSVFNTNTSPFGQTNTASSPFGQPNTASSPFGQSNTASSPFGQTHTASSPFGQTNNASSPFGQSNTAPSPFAQNNTAPSPFGQNTAQSIFASAVQANASIPNSNTAASIFATGNQNVPGNSPFGSLPNSENQRSMFAKDQQEDLGIYSRIDEVDAEDLEAFKASSFKLGFVPEIPPPLSLCSVQIKSGF